MIPARLYRQSCVCLSLSLLSRSRIHKTVRPSWTGLESFYDRHYASKAVACRPWTVIYHLYSQSPSADKRDGLIERREIKLFSLSSMRRAHMCIYENSQVHPIIASRQWAPRFRVHESRWPSSVHFFCRRISNCWLIRRNNARWYF